MNLSVLKGLNVTAFSAKGGLGLNTFSIGQAYLQKYICFSGKFLYNKLCVQFSIVETVLRFAIRL